VRSEHHVEVGDLSKQLRSIALADTPPYRNQLPRAYRFGALEGTCLPAEPFLGVLTHAARHEHHDICIFGRSDRSHALGRKQTGDALRVVFVHLAPEGADQVGLHGVGECSTRF